MRSSWFQSLQSSFGSRWRRRFLAVAFVLGVVGGFRGFSPGQRPAELTSPSASSGFNGAEENVSASRSQRGPSHEKNFSSPQQEVPQSLPPDASEGSALESREQESTKATRKKAWQEHKRAPATTTAQIPVVRVQSRSYIVRDDLRLATAEEISEKAVRLGAVGTRLIIRRADEVAGGHRAGQAGVAREEQGWIVEDSVNHRLGWLSGSVFVEFESWGARDAVSYSIRREFPTIRSAIFDIQARDLSQFQLALQELKSARGVLRVEPEILFRGVKPQ
jgi:hypothetical protein